MIYVRFFLLPSPDDPLPSVPLLLAFLRESDSLIISSAFKKSSGSSAAIYLDFLLCLWIYFRHKWDRRFLLSGKIFIPCSQLAVVVVMVLLQ